MSETEQETPETVEEPTPDETEVEADAEQDANGPEGVPAEPQQSAEELDEAFKRIERSYKTYSRAVENNLGEQKADWLGCPLCAPGAIPGFFNRHDIGNVPEEIEANVQMVLGYARERDYPKAQHVNPCGDCNGLGKVSTGSQVAEHMLVTCPNCRGYGYMPPPPRHGEHAPTNGVQPVESQVSSEDFETPDRDNWGEPRILPDGTLNDNYGKQPQFKSRHPIYGETRLLTGEELAGVAEVTS